MSYCRFSSDDWKSDVYVYDDIGGYWAIYVASSRLEGPIPTVPNILTTPREEWTKAYKIQMDTLNTSKRTPIGLPFDGAFFQESSPEEAAKRLMNLRDAGYYVPQYAIDDLLNEVGNEDLEEENESHN